MSQITAEIINKLSGPMARGAISIKPGSVKKDGTAAMVLTYVDSRAVQIRLDELFPGEWSFDWETAPQFGELLAVEGILTICGVKRCDVGQAVGNGKEEEPYKCAVSDALKRCAVQFGVGRYLYDLPVVWWPGKRGDNGKGFYFDRSWDAVDHMESVIAAVAEGRAIPKCPAKVNDECDPQEQPSQAPKQAPSTAVGCADCGVVIEGTTTKSGKSYTAQQIIAYAMKDFGRPLCSACQWKLKEAKKASAAA